MKQLLAVLILSFSLPTMALGCDISNVHGLDAVAVQKIKLACEQAKLDAKEFERQAEEPTTMERVVSMADQTVTTEKISAFGQASRDVAIAIGLAAKELGIAANDFLITPAGILVASVVLWKLFGLQFLGLMFCFMAMFVAAWIIRRAMVEEYTDVEKVRLWGLYTATKRKATYTTFKNMDANQGFTIVITSIVCLLLIWIFLANLVVV